MMNVVQVDKIDELAEQNGATLADVEVSPAPGAWVRVRIFEPGGDDKPIARCDVGPEGEVRT